MKIEFALSKEDVIELLVQMKLSCYAMRFHLLGTMLTFVKNMGSFTHYIFLTRPISKLDVKEDTMCDEMRLDKTNCHALTKLKILSMHFGFCFEGTPEDVCSCS